MNQEETVPAILRPLPLPEQTSSGSSRRPFKGLLVCFALFFLYLLLKR